MISQLMARQQTSQQVISNNIANVNTPDWKAREASFERTLDQVVGDSKITSDESGRTYAHRIVERAGLLIREDGNNVDIDLELGRMDKASLLFNSYSQILASKLQMLRMAIGR